MFDRSEWLLGKELAECLQLSHLYLGGRGFAHAEVLDQREIAQGALLRSWLGGPT